MKFRYARHTNNLKSISEFYRKVIGLEKLGGFENHSNYSGVFFGVPNLDWHLEFTESDIKTNRISDEDDLLVFYVNSDEELQATFKVVKNSKTNVTDAVIRTRVIAAINEFFALDNWDFGDSFYYTELAAYIHNQLAPDLLTAVIVPNQTGQSFGSLFQINSAADEIFISGATVDDVSIITALGAFFCRFTIFIRPWPIL